MLTAFGLTLLLLQHSNRCKPFTLIMVSHSCLPQEKERSEFPCSSPRFSCTKFIFTFLRENGKARKFDSWSQQQNADRADGQTDGQPKLSHWQRTIVDYDALHTSRQELRIFGTTISFSAKLEPVENCQKYFIWRTYQINPLKYADCCRKWFENTPAPFWTRISTITSLNLTFYFSLKRCTSGRKFKLLWSTHLSPKIRPKHKSIWNPSHCYPQGGASNFTVSFLKFHWFNFPAFLYRSKVSFTRSRIRSQNKY